MLKRRRRVSGLPDPNTHPGVEIFRDVNVFREDDPVKGQEIYAHQRREFTSSGSGNNWKLYREEGEAAAKWFISYQGIRLNTDHGIPMGIITKPVADTVPPALLGMYTKAAPL